MPNCRNCNAPIFFLTVEPNQYESNPKPVPIDVNPDPAGTLAIYEIPNPDSVYPAHGRDFQGERKRYFRRLGGFALEFYKRSGGSVWRIHFDTCRGPRR